MRKIREITSKEENFRVVPLAPGAVTTKCDPIQPEPIGTIILIPFKIIGYDQDCDGSLMARLGSLGLDDIKNTGWETSHIGLYPDSGFVVSKKELSELIKRVG